MKFQKLLAIAAVTTGIGAVAAPASAAEAAPSAQPAAVAAAAGCSSAITFTYRVDSRKNWLQINCGDIARGTAWVTALSGNRFKLRVVDSECDSFGFSLRLHGHTVSTDGCGNAVEKTVTRSSIGNPQNWWVYANGRTNSQAYPLPVY